MSDGFQNCEIYRCLFWCTFLVHFYKSFVDLAQKNFVCFFLFFLTNMESIKCENNTTEHNKHVLNF